MRYMLIRPRCGVAFMVGTLQRIMIINVPAACSSVSSSVVGWRSIILVVLSCFIFVDLGQVLNLGCCDVLYSCALAASVERNKPHSELVAGPKMRWHGDCMFEKQCPQCKYWGATGARRHPFAARPSATWRDVAGHSQCPTTCLRVFGVEGLMGVPKRLPILSSP